MNGDGRPPEGNAAWSSGYVVDLDYVPQSYNEMAPTVIDWALEVQNLAPPRRPGEPFTYLELGCGQASTLLGIAAAHPEAQFYGCDFNPNHIASARAFAERAKLGNVTLLEEDFAELTRRDLPPCDYIALHGVYSWVGETAREQIRAIIRRLLKPGGALYNSYNCTAGCAAIVPLRDLMRQQTAATSGSFETRIRAMVAVLTQLKAAGFPYFAHNPPAANRLANLTDADPRYIAHEFLNEAWTSFSHAEMAAEMDRAKLSYVGPALFAEQFDDLYLPQEWQKLVAETENELLREALKDLLISQSFRRDIFVRGGVPLGGNGARRRLSRHYALARARPNWTDEVTLAGGVRALKLEMFGPMLERLADSTATGFEAVQAGAGPLHTGPVAMINTLLALGHIRPAMAPAQTMASRQAVAAHNRAAMTLNRDHIRNMLFAISPVTGGFHSIDIIDQLHLLAEVESPQAPLQAVIEWLLRRNIQPVLGGQVCPAAELPERMAKHRHVFLDTRLPLLRGLGLLP